MQHVEEFYFLRFKTSYVIFTSASLCSDGDNLLICFIVPWRTGLRFPMYKCIGAGYTITLRKSKVNKVTEPCEKLLQKQIGYSFKGGWEWRGGGGDEKKSYLRRVCIKVDFIRENVCHSSTTN